MIASNLFDTLPDSVSALHRKGWPDHRIASRLKVGLPWVRRERKRLGIAAHPAGSRLTEEQVWEQLLQWDRFIWKYAQGWVKKYPELDVEDVRSEAIAGALRAGERFDPRRLNEETGQPLVFTSFAVHWMRNQVQRYVERELAYGMKLGEDARGRIVRAPVFQFADDQRPEDWLPDVRAEGEVAAEGIESLWARLTDGLTEQELLVSVLRFRKNESIGRIAKRVRRSPDEVEVLLGRATAWMRKRA